ncbi:MAG: phosphate acyltransferase, partial [bacterium]
MVRNFDELLQQALTCKGKRVVVVFPGNIETLQAVYDASDRNLARFILIGDEEIINRKLGEMGETRKPFEIIHRPKMTDALKTSIEYVKDGKCDVLMKGAVDTSTLMKAVLQDDSGIKTGRLLTDIFILEFPQRPDNKFVLITDGGMTLAPDLKNKVELINNAVEVAHALGNLNPKVAVLS